MQEVHFHSWRHQTLLFQFQYLIKIYIYKNYFYTPTLKLIAVRIPTDDFSSFHFV